MRKKKIRKFKNIKAKRKKSYILFTLCIESIAEEPEENRFHFFYWSFVIFSNSKKYKNTCSIHRKSISCQKNYLEIIIYLSYSKQILYLVSQGGGRVLKSDNITTAINSHCFEGQGYPPPCRNKLGM